MGSLRRRRYQIIAVAPPRLRARCAARARPRSDEVWRRWGRGADDARMMRGRCAARGVLIVSIMRVKRLTTWLVLGIAVALAYAARRRHGIRSRRAVPAGAADTSAAERDPDLT